MKKSDQNRELLTGHIVPELEENVVISIVTCCPKKWVIVDLETGNQYSSNGIPVGDTESRQTWSKPIRRLTIPKPRKNKNELAK